MIIFSFSGIVMIYFNQKLLINKIFKIQ